MNKSSQQKQTILRLTTAALILPGLLPVVTHAAEDDSVDFQYSHYQEGERQNVEIAAPTKWVSTSGSQTWAKVPVPNHNPIEVDSLHGSARVTLTDRVKFAFNYIQDTWSGATPYGSTPAQSGAIYHNGYSNPASYDDKGKPILSGASAFAAYGFSLLQLNKQGQSVHFLNPEEYNPPILFKDRIVHVMGYASPETRQQGDFKLSYQWDEAALDVGGGISVENDYESRFVNIGGRMDFNQKQTTMDLGLSYTHSDINAELDPLGDNYFTWTGQHNDQINFDPATGLTTLSGTRQDWGVRLGLTQIVNKDAIGKLGMSYTRSNGFLENPYKLSWIYDKGSSDPYLKDTFGIDTYYGRGFIEQRPNERNLFQWSTGWVQYIEPLEAALHFDYSFAHDDWGINAHTFEGDWVQPLGSGWTITPRIRYYSQSAADFYGAYFFGGGTAFDYNSPLPDDPSIKTFNPPDNFSSDQRLSGYGALSGGVTVEKQFAKGVSLQAGFEYYTHQGGLKMGGGGEGNFADYDYWVANAALKVNLGFIGLSNLDGNHNHANHLYHANIPAGVWFGHTLDKSGDMMIGYRYQRNWLANGFRYGDSKASTEQIIANGCPELSDGCLMLPREMTTNMHMLDIMYAPTDWLTLMLMPQFMDMSMPSYHPDADTSGGSHHMGDAIAHDFPTGGVGDTGIYALINLFDRPNHHLHLGVGVTAPTGDIAIRQKSSSPGKADEGYVHYGMQLGSGTWDLKPSLTYIGKTGDWSWGAQVTGTKRLESHNSSGYALGDAFETSLWGGYDWTSWLSSTVRIAYNWQGAVKGRYPKWRVDRAKKYDCPKVNFTTYSKFDENGYPIDNGVFDAGAWQACLDSKNHDPTLDLARDDRTSPMDYTSNYGGNYVDIGLGISATVPSGAFAGNRLAFEWLQPVYTNVNGYQLNRDGALSFTWSYGF
ncbi:MAG: DUF3570 domain-containing protein [Methylococcaceae bacterium]|nr:DUF3570 domain-containing protein [Methylococcaceae bacterium]